MKNSEKYPELDSLLGAYFNPDWNDDYNTPEEVISTFARDGNKKDLEKAIQELKILLQEQHTFKEWENILYDNFGCEYYFDYEKDYTPKEFLEKVLKQFEKELLLAKED